jgi:hypothetical protein
MDKEIIFENEFLTIWYYNSKKIIHHQFHQFTHGKTFRDGLTEGAATFENKGADKWLSDDRKNPVMKQDDMQWTATVWRPRVINAGLKYRAIVLPESTVGQMAMNKIIKEYTGLGVTIQAFSDPDKALKWLESL